MHMEDLLLAIRAIEDNPRRFLDRGTRPYNTDLVCSDLKRAYMSWQFNVKPLVDFFSQDLRKLITKRDGGGHDRRKPKAYFTVSVTSKGNFALDWYPREYVSKHYDDLGDWLMWSDARGMGGDWLPENRLLFVRGFGDLLKSLKNEDKGRVTGDGEDDWQDETTKRLVLAMRNLLDNIYEFLGGYVEVVHFSDFVVEHHGASIACGIVQYEDDTEELEKIG